MKSALATLAGLCVLATGLLSTAVAAPHDFSFRQGPRSMVIGQLDFRQFHSHLTNTGDNADSYTLTVTANDPSDWSFGVCYGDVCYDPALTEFTVPAEGTLAPGEVVDFDFDITALFEPGEADYTVTFTSNADPSVTGTWTYDARTPSEPVAMLFSPGEGVIHADNLDYVQFHTMLYNAGLDEDSYHLSMTSDLPSDWTASFCIDEVCYSPEIVEIGIPVGGGTIASAGAVAIDIDVTVLFESGQGTVVVSLVSDTDPTIRSTAAFIITTGSVVAVTDLPGALVTDLRAAPNPFNPRTDIRFTVGGDVPRDAVIDILDARGRHVRRLRAGTLAPGPRSVAWDGADGAGRTVSTGVYLARVRVGDESRVLKMSLLK